MKTFALLLALAVGAQAGIVRHTVRDTKSVVKHVSKDALHGVKFIVTKIVF